MVRAFREALGQEIFVPESPETSGALGAALLLKRELAHNKNRPVQAKVTGS